MEGLSAPELRIIQVRHLSVNRGFPPQTDAGFDWCTAVGITAGGWLSCSAEPTGSVKAWFLQSVEPRIKTKVRD
jgi:hypothetical protein